MKIQCPYCKRELLSDELQAHLAEHFARRSAIRRMSQNAVDLGDYDRYVEAE